MIDRMKAVAARWFDELWVHRREDNVDAVMAELAHPDAFTRVQGREGTIDVEEFKKYRRALIDAIPDMRVEIRAIAAEGDWCFVEWRVVGTHLGHGLGIPPSGRPATFRGMTSLRFVNGLIMEGHDSWNRGELIAGLMQVRLDEIRAKTRLTAREAQVALMMAERLTHVEIAEQLGISQSTARRHSERVLVKLGLHDRREVAAALGKIPGSPGPG
jgi:DNA-binding CsgD family transcriptional regulator